MKKQVLGKGLSALLSEAKEEYVLPNEEVKNQEVKTSLLFPLDNQPRHFFDEESLEELAQSIREKGIIQPILVRSNGGKFDIIAGERRWRAAMKAGLLTVPVLIKDFDDEQSLHCALIENVQRQDLNPLEEAKAYHYLMETYSYTQSDLSRIVSKSRSHIANLIRLLKLDPDVQKMVASGDLSFGHARALLTVEDQKGLAHKIIEDQLSVRQTEEMIYQKPKKNKPIPEVLTKEQAAIQGALNIDAAVTVLNGQYKVVLSSLDHEKFMDLMKRLV